MTKFTDEQLIELSRLAEDVASVEDIGEYGYGGEIFPYTIVTNWLEVVQAVLNRAEELKDA